jgi:hypothetical protein
MRSVTCRLGKAGWYWVEVEKVAVAFALISSLKAGVPYLVRQPQDPVHTYFLIARAAGLVRAQGVGG